MKAFAASIVLIAASLATANAKDTTKPFRAIDYPLEVRKALSYGPEECRRQGGGKVTFAPDTVRKVDLNGDGRDDYVVSFQDTECSGRESVYCGTAGCSMDFLLTLPNGKIRNVFSDRIRGYEIRGRAVRFELHGAYCGGAGNPSCFKEQRITARPFVFTEPRD